MYGYVYETVNNITGDIYIGRKKSKEFIKSYYGSGKNIKAQLKIYGKQNFTVRIIKKAKNKDELDLLEIKYIKKCKDMYGDKCINQAKGGLGNNVFEYASDIDKIAFRKKMQKINKERTNTKEFKEKTGKRMREKFKNQEERNIQSKKAKKIWSDEKLRSKQSEILKEYYKTHKKDNSYRCKKCAFEHGGIVFYFNSQKELKKFLKDTYDVKFLNTDFKRMIESGESYTPFHKNNKKLQRLKGMRIYYI